MPSNITASLYDGKPTTFEEFVWRSVRATLIEMKEEPDDKPIPEKFEFRAHHRDGIKRCRAKLDELLSRDDDTWKKEATDAYEFALKHHKECEQNRSEVAQRYKAMLTKVRVWEPPSPDYVDFKNLMIRFLTESLKQDCHHPGELPKKENYELEHYRTTSIDFKRRDIGYHEEYWEKEQKQTQELNDWLAGLRKSVPQPVVEGNVVPEGLSHRGPIKERREWNALCEDLDREGLIDIAWHWRKATKRLLDAEKQARDGEHTPPPKVT